MIVVGYFIAMLTAMGTVYLLGDYLYVRIHNRIVDRRWQEQCEAIARIRRAARSCERVAR